MPNEMMETLFAWIIVLGGAYGFGLLICNLVADGIKLKDFILGHVKHKQSWLRLISEEIQVAKYRWLQKKLCKVVSKLTGQNVITILKYGAADGERKDGTPDV